METSFNKSIYKDLSNIIDELNDVANNEVVIEELGGKVEVILMALNYIKNRIENREGFEERNN